MKAKNPPEPKAAKEALHSLELNLRPLPHPVIGRREVVRGQRVHGDTDEQLLLRAHCTLVGMLGYRPIGMAAYAALAAEVINQMPEEYRRLAVNMIITGDAMELTEEVVYHSSSPGAPATRWRSQTRVTNAVCIVPANMTDLQN
jgi:hypothetical protein